MVQKIKALLIYIVVYILIRCISVPAEKPSYECIATRDTLFVTSGNFSAYPTHSLYKTIYIFDGEQIDVSVKHAIILVVNSTKRLSSFHPQIQNIQISNEVAEQIFEIQDSFIIDHPILEKLIQRNIILSYLDKYKFLCKNKTKGFCKFKLKRQLIRQKNKNKQNSVGQIYVNFILEQKQKNNEYEENVENVQNHDIQKKQEQNKLIVKEMNFQSQYFSPVEFDSDDEQKDTVFESTIVAINKQQNKAFLNHQSNNGNNVNILQQSKPIKKTQIKNSKRIIKKVNLPSETQNHLPMAQQNQQDPIKFFDLTNKILFQQQKLTKKAIKYKQQQQQNQIKDQQIVKYQNQQQISSKQKLIAYQDKQDNSNESFQIINDKQNINYAKTGKQFQQNNNNFNLNPFNEKQQKQQKIQKIISQDKIKKQRIMEVENSQIQITQNTNINSQKNFEEKLDNQENNQGEFFYNNIQQFNPNSISNQFLIQKQDIFFIQNVQITPNDQFNNKNFFSVQKQSKQQQTINKNVLPIKRQQKQEYNIDNNILLVQRQNFDQNVVPDYHQQKQQQNVNQNVLSVQRQQKQKQMIDNNVLIVQHQSKQQQIIDQNILPSQNMQKQEQMIDNNVLKVLNSPKQQQIIDQNILPVLSFQKQKQNADINIFSGQNQQEQSVNNNIFSGQNQQNYNVNNIIFPVQNQQKQKQNTDNNIFSIQNQQKQKQDVNSIIFPVQNSQQQQSLSQLTQSDSQL